MILLLIFAIYVIVTRRVAITRTFILSGTNARNYGVALLVTLIPAVIALNLLVRMLPAVLRGPVVSRVVATVLLGAFAVALALPFRDQPGDGARRSS